MAGIKKITDQDVATHGVAGCPDVLSGTADENKAVFDRLVRDCVKKVVNDVIDEMNEMGKAVTDKVDKEDGKGLSSNDYTTEEKKKLEELTEEIKGKADLVETTGAEPGDVLTVGEDSVPVWLPPNNQATANVTKAIVADTKQAEVVSISDKQPNTRFNQFTIYGVSRQDGTRVSSEDFSIIFSTTLERENLAPDTVDGYYTLSGSGWLFGYMSVILPKCCHYSVSLRLKDGKNVPEGVCIGFVFSDNEVNWLVNNGVMEKSFCSANANNKPLATFSIYPSDKLAEALDAFEIMLVEGEYNETTMPDYIPYCPSQAVRVPYVLRGISDTNGGWLARDYIRTDGTSVWKVQEVADSGNALSIPVQTNITNTEFGQALLTAVNTKEFTSVRTMNRGEMIGWGKNWAPDDMRQWSDGTAYEGNWVPFGQVQLDAGINTVTVTRGSSAYLPLDTIRLTPIKTWESESRNESDSPFINPHVASDGQLYYKGSNNGSVMKIMSDSETPVWVTSEYPGVTVLPDGTVVDYWGVRTSDACSIRFSIDVPKAGYYTLSFGQRYEFGQHIVEVNGDDVKPLYQINYNQDANSVINKLKQEVDQWRLIREVELTEDSIVSFTTDKAGNALDLKKVQMLIVCPKREEATQAWLNFNGMLAVNCTSLAATASSPTFFMKGEFESYRKDWRFYTISSTAGVTTSTSVQSSPRGHRNTAAIPNTMRDIKLALSSNMTTGFPTGTKITVWGVDAE